MIEKNGIVPENNEWRCVNCKKYEETHGMCEYCRYEPVIGSQEDKGEGKAC